MPGGVALTLGLGAWYSTGMAKTRQTARPSPAWRVRAVSRRHLRVTAGRPLTAVQALKLAAEIVAVASTVTTGAA